MHEVNIEQLREEAQRLLQVEISLLEKMQHEPGVISDVRIGEKQTFDSDSIKKLIEIIQGEQAKLEGLEMVLAVVGTMKAGKSTTINAIVGTEVLPNRNRPMTALPTLIRHTPGQIEPILKFDNNVPINNLISTLNRIILSPNGQRRLTNLDRNPDMDELLEHIRKNKQFGTLYHGADNIFWFLKSLNDLVRLSTELNAAFPFSDYDEIHELPVIEVEFAHLREMEQSNGRLTLLDTPGPNESGQQHLRKMLKEQLTKASAVLAVLDFTQLKSDADAEVRKELEEIASVTDGRLYALVNKFDQKDRHGDSEDQIKAFVSEDLMQGMIQKNNVFPVSSRWGYLANRAKHEIFMHKKLPDHSEKPWVIDFAEEAFGRRWESKITDIEEVQSAANALWKDSLFSEPLDQVIRAAHARAAAYAIDSAAAKLIDNAEKLGNFLGLRETALAKSTRELQQQIESLINDINKIENSEKVTLKNVNDTLLDISKSTEEVFDKIKKSAISTLDSYFKEGKRIEKEQYENKTEIRLETKRQTNSDEYSGSPFGDLFKTFFNAISNNPNIKPGSDFDPENPLMRFNNSSEAENIINNINTSVENIMTGAEETMQRAMSLIINKFNEHFVSVVVNDTQKIINELTNRMKSEGFIISIKKPDVTAVTLNFSGREMLSDIINEKTETVTRSRKKTGMFSRFANFINDNWGRETYEEDEKYFEIDMKKVQAGVSYALNNSFSGLNESVSEYIRTPLKNGVTEFFTEFKQTVEQIRGDLLQSIRDQERSKSEQDDLATRLAVLKKNVPALLHDSNGLKLDVTPLLTESKEICE